MSAPYYLAVDVGTSRVSAAIARIAPDGSPLAVPVPLGRSSDNAPTVAFVTDGDVLFGDAAERRGSAQPDRLIREYKRRIGDDVPIRAGERAFSPEELYALTIDWAARVAVEREGDTPARLMITVPAAWGEHRSEVVRGALATRGWRDVQVMTEPEAAARHYESTNPLSPGQALAVYDFGGGTFDAVVLRKEPSGDVSVVGAPLGIDHLGGADFDDAIVRHIVRAAKVDATSLAGTAAGRMALAALRRECVEAKESLSFDSEAVVPVILSGEQETVRLTRDEFEIMIADDLERTVATMEKVIDDAGIDVSDLDAILLTGGSSRIPRVAQLLSEHFDRPVAVDADPKAIIALGAARAVIDAAMADASANAVALVDDDTDELDAAVEDEADAEPAQRRPWFRRITPTAYAVGALALVVGGAGVAVPALGLGAATFAEDSSDDDGTPFSFADNLLLPLRAPSGAIAAEIAPVVAEAVVQPEAAPPQTSNAEPRSETRRTTGREPRKSSTQPTSSDAAPAQPKSNGTTPTQPTANTGSTTPTTPSGTSSTPSPQPEPSTDPQPQPTSDPEPTTDPEPQPTSDPEPTTDPEPQPTSDPEPQPTGDPAPEPTPEQTSSAPSPEPTA